ncbi:unnamed protein product [Trichogramma brassicae]|uniref:Uncharacterized protein n=1 Tax=Trichogramma brassicae TaxID=86971 RepID=A0A6H5I214_9HYME|nr:unnamed protein product [Trichogramma brassicae]
MPAMCDHAADGSGKGDTTIDDGIVQDRRFTKLKEDESLNPYRRISLCDGWGMYGKTTTTQK